MHSDIAISLNVLLLYRKLHGVECHSLCCSEVTRKFFTEVEGWHMPQFHIAGEATDCLVLTLRINRNYTASQKNAQTLKRYSSKL